LQCHIIVSPGDHINRHVPVTALQWMGNWFIIRSMTCPEKKIGCGINELASFCVDERPPECWIWTQSRNAPFDIFDEGYSAGIRRFDCDNNTNWLYNNTNVVLLCSAVSRIKACSWRFTFNLLLP
jgi:hypothetical protein